MVARVALVVLLFSLLLTAPGRAQVIEEGHGESVASGGKGPAAGEADVDRAAELIVKQTNAFREEQGRKPVQVDPKLRETARYFADFMARTDKYGHTADGSRPADRAKKHGYEYCIVAENIAYEYSSAGFTTDKLAGLFVTGWQNSPPHRKNMLDADVTDTGVAVARSEKTGYYYAVQMFGRPRSARIEFKVANQSDASIQYTIEGQSFPLPPRYIRTHERCRPADVTFRWPDAAGEADKGGTQTVRPADGDQLIVTGGPDGFTVKKD